MIMEQEEHKHHRHDDAEYIEDHFVGIKFCEGRHADMNRRLDSMESLVERLGDDTRKNNKQLAIIMSIVVFVGTVAGLVLQYFAIIHQVNP